MREIFARWQRDAAAYRERMQAEENAELGLAYGTSPRQTVDLFFPDATGHTPLALFVHGGYWRSLDAVDLQPHVGRAELRAASRSRSRATISARR